ncbi:MAG: hypothetical protein GWN61_23340, partial [candidate division Zixibacteria bacterium]|nr:hypothetical protein [candidate division Zixibacteria bacterium]NIU16865.1 hypothetical protein [candidate division Zixibacteria bacterium]NIV09026.1 hypothetical protein [candidate division Zixibacteria bacterium]NIW49918.1 hypothetical protein [Gammaproteobacteria bacterium]
WESEEFADQSSQVQAVAAISGIHDFTVAMPTDINNIIYEAFGKYAGNDDPENVTASPVSYITP